MALIGLLLLLAQVEVETLWGQLVVMHGYFALSPSSFFLISLKGWTAKEPVTNGQPVLSSNLAIRQG